MATTHQDLTQRIQDVRDDLTRALEAWKMGDHARARALVETAHAASGTALEQASDLQRQQQQPPMT